MVTSMMQDRFQTTQWTLFQQLSSGSEEDAQMALGVICEHYWFPLYAFVRRKGYSREDAQDILQNFFLNLISSDWLQKADAKKGRLRTYLMMVIKRQIASDWRKLYAQKRGAGEACVSFESLDAEDWYMQSPQEMSSEVLFDYQWAVALLGHSMRDLEEQYSKRDQWDRFDTLKCYLEWSGQDHESGGRDEYKEVAQLLQMTEGAVKVAVYRLRKQFRQILLGHVRETLGAEQLDSLAGASILEESVTDAEVEQELRHLFHVLGSVQMADE